ncbi:calcium/sodium antiporter [Polaribacter sp.]|uniref:calcium/sodium antiporter n=1 Tax=Polaribacter sp. TaxID=1920175 RepID=UPI004047EDDC
MNFLLIAGGLILLILGGNWLLKSAVALSLKLEIPKIVIGMTVVSFATSAPELIVSVNAALNGASDLSLGNVVGSNIANISLILGVTLLFGSMEVQKSFYKTDWPVMMLASMVLFFFLTNDKIITQFEGIIFVTLLIAFLIFLLRFQKTTIIEEIPNENETLLLWKIIFFLTIGGVGLWGGSEFLITGATALAKDFGVSDRVIGVTVVSIGTSIPELAASIIAILKKEKAISLGNLVGSNIFNILGVLGITAIITPIAVVDQKFLTNDIFWMLAISLLILPMVLVPKRLKLNWIDGVVLLFIYSGFVYWTL